jgi:hypothetical protein
MSQITLEALSERMAALETMVRQLLNRQAQPTPPRDWRRTVGMFSGDLLMQEIFEAGRQIRVAERERL